MTSLMHKNATVAMMAEIQILFSIQYGNILTDWGLISDEVSSLPPLADNLHT